MHDDITTTRLPTHLIRRLAVDADCAEVTVRKFLRGERIRGACGDRIATVVARSADPRIAEFGNVPGHPRPDATTASRDRAR